MTRMDHGYHVKMFFFSVEFFVLFYQRQGLALHLRQHI